MAAPAALALAGHIGAAVAHFVFVFHGNAFAAPVFAGGAALPTEELELGQGLGVRLVAGGHEAIVREQAVAADQQNAPHL